MSESGDGVMEQIRRDPPRIDDIGKLQAVARFKLGNRLYVHDQEYTPDGRVVAYLGTSQAVDTSPWPGDNELSFRNYAPIGALIAESDGDEWVVRCPGRDALCDALQTRRSYEDEQQAAVIPSILNLLDGRRDMHYDEADEYGIHDVDSLGDLDLGPSEMFHLGRAVGMQKMASLAHRTLTKRLETPYAGDRKWESREYSVARSRRTEDFPPEVPHGE